MNDDQRTAIFSRLRAENPEPTTELDFGTPFELLIAVMLSAQATDVGVNRATARLFPAARTPAAMLALGPDRLRDFIRTIGLFNTKAETVRCRPSGVREAARRGLTSIRPACSSAWPTTSMHSAHVRHPPWGDVRNRQIAVKMTCLLSR